MSESLAVSVLIILNFGTYNLSATAEEIYQALIVGLEA